jgi:hypothetical protein
MAVGGLCCMLSTSMVIAGGLRKESAYSILRYFVHIRSLSLKCGYALKIILCTQDTSWFYGAN